jgi:hypothetical protein
MLEPLPGRCTDGAGSVQAGQLGILRSVYVTADIPPGPGVLRGAAVFVEPVKPFIARA